MVDWTELHTGAEAALALPEGQPRGSVVVGGELFGITSYVCDVVERFAAAGYVALAPDFYWRSGRRIALSYDQAGRERGFALAGALRPEAVIADVAAAREVARDHAGGVGGTAMAGFSIGGHIGLLAATKVAFDLVAAVYAAWTLDGGGPIVEDRPPLDDAAAIAGFDTKILGVVGDADHVLPQEEWRRIDAHLSAAGVRHDLITYRGLPHGFMCPDRPETYDHEATEDVWRRLFDALERCADQPGDA